MLRISCPCDFVFLEYKSWKFKLKILPVGCFMAFGHGYDESSGKDGDNLPYCDLDFIGLSVLGAYLGRGDGCGITECRLRIFSANPHPRPYRPHHKDTRPSVY